MNNNPLTITRLRVLFDANVLFSWTNRNIIMYLASDFDPNFFQPLWSANIHQEWSDNLLQKFRDNPLVTRASLDKTIALMNLEVPNSLVDGYEHLLMQEVVSKINKKDGHVLAAAIFANAQFIVSNDDRFQTEVNYVASETMIDAIDIKDFYHYLFQRSPRQFLEGLQRFWQWHYRNPPISADNFVARLANSDLPQPLIQSFIQQQLP